MYIGPVDTGLTPQSSYQIYGLPYIYKYDIKPHFNDFRDYPPYTTITLQTMCGNVELDPYIYMNHTVQVHFYLDIVTGSCIVYIFRDNLVMQQIQGRFGSNVVITAANMGQYQNSIATLETAYQQSLSSTTGDMIQALSGGAMTIAGIALGNPILMVGGVAGFASGINSAISEGKTSEQIEYNINHVYPSIHQIGSTPTVNNLLLQYIPKLLIKRCKMSDGFNAESYGKTVGYACNINGKVKDFSGFTVAYNIDLDNVKCSVKEKELIKGLFNSGVYL